MSHVATIDVEINDIPSLKKACEENGWTFCENQKTYKWYGRWVNDYHGDNAAYKNGVDPSNYGKCEHAIKVSSNPGAYEIGVARNKEGKLVLIWDFWGGTIEKACGKNCKKLYDSYVKHVTVKKMKAKGYVLSKTEVKNNQTELAFAKYS